ncbi:Aste57867_14277 [Aphanomyces stellatus]|uniref:Aste57867_14277 protein n=1 Tax=Aphanomyces stellatus TaxID=120398 RepID=A0A485L2P5_9STRA|nr:hypothetical protein As57867_014225 [Aphanomyces stellatus]VFT91102.1 Aste57867_14277 [Aphanomyces stellatus]
MSPRIDLDTRGDANADLDMIMQKNMRKLRMKQVSKKKQSHHTPSSSAPLQPLGNLPSLSPSKDKQRRDTKASFKKQLFNEKDGDAVADKSTYDMSTSPAEEKRRSITIFDCAKIVDTKGRVMTHEEFEMVSSSPSSVGSSCSTLCSSASPSSDSSLGKSKSKKLFSKKSIKSSKASTSEMLRQMAWEQMVLEIMDCLLPEIDVLSELNRTLVQSRVTASEASIDLVGFQQQLHYHLDALHKDDAELPAPFTSGSKLVSMYVNKALVQSVTFGLMTVTDKRARVALGSISIAIYQHVPDVRSDMLQAIECCAIEMYNLPESVNMKTYNVESVVHLAGAIVRFQHELSVQVQQSLFEDDLDVGAFVPPTDDDNAVYDSVKRSLALFCRAWSCGSVSPANSSSMTSPDALFTASANLASNSTVKSLLASVQLLAHVSPHHGLAFLTESLLRRWPTRNTARQLLFLRLIPMLLVQLASAQVYMEAFTKAVYDAFSRIQQCILSPHVLVAREACALCDDMHLIRLFLLRDKALLDKLTTALHVNANHHWNKQIQALSDDHFDSMLDLA